MWITGSEIGVFRAGLAEMGKFRYQGDKVLILHTMALCLILIIGHNSIIGKPPRS